MAEPYYIPSAVNVGAAAMVGHEPRRTAAMISEGLCPYDHGDLDQNGWCDKCQKAWWIHSMEGGYYRLGYNFVGGWERRA